MATALVTGAGRGIGRAIARRLAKDGYSLIVVDVLEDAAADVAAEVGGRAAVCDLSDPQAIERLTAGVEELSVLVNNAGIFPPGSVADVSVDEFHRVMGVNVLAPLLLIQQLLPQLQAAQGAVVNIASAAAHAATPGLGVYSPSKAALVSLTKLCAMELAGTGVRFNAVCPGGVMTEGTASYAADPEREARFNAVMPLGRRAYPEEIADAVAFFASADSRYITGQTLLVDGGLTEATFNLLRAVQSGP
jgi:3-oxoacyl-[acyl-carrier protein] reductase